MLARWEGVGAVVLAGLVGLAGLLVLAGWGVAVLARLLVLAVRFLTPLTVPEEAVVASLAGFEPLGAFEPAFEPLEGVDCEAGGETECGADCVVGGEAEPEADGKVEAGGEAEPEADGGPEAGGGAGGETS